MHRVNTLVYSFFSYFLCILYMGETQRIEKHVKQHLMDAISKIQNVGNNTNDLHSSINKWCLVWFP